MNHFSFWKPFPNEAREGYYLMVCIVFVVCRKQNVEFSLCTSTSLFKFKLTFFFSKEQRTNKKWFFFHNGRRNDQANWMKNYDPQNAAWYFSQQLTQAWARISILEWQESQTIIRNQKIHFWPVSISAPKYSKKLKAKTYYLLRLLILGLWFESFTWVARWRPTFA